MSCLDNLYRPCTDNLLEYVEAKKRFPAEDKYQHSGMKLFTHDGTPEGFRQGAMRVSNSHQKRNIVRNERNAYKSYLKSQANKNEAPVSKKEFRNSTYESTGNTLATAVSKHNMIGINKDLAKGMRQVTKMQDPNAKFSLRKPYEHEKEHLRQASVAKKLFGRQGLNRINMLYGKSASKAFTSLALSGGKHMQNYSNHPLEFGANKQALGIKQNHADRVDTVKSAMGVKGYKPKFRALGNVGHQLLQTLMKKSVIKKN